MAAQVPSDTFPSLVTSGDMDSCIVSNSVCSTSVAVLDVTAQAPSGKHQYSATSDDIAFFILTDIIYFSHVAEVDVTAVCIQTV